MASRYRKFPAPLQLRCRWAFVLLACLLPLSSQAAHLEFVSEVDGTITDVTQTRTMFFTMENGWPTLKVHNRNSGSVQTIPPIEGEIPVNEWLTYRGAIFGWTSDVGTAVQEWTGGALRLYDGTPRGLQVAPVARQYAIWPIWIAGQGRFLHLRDMLLLQNHRVGNAASTTWPTSATAASRLYPRPRAVQRRPLPQRPDHTADQSDGYLYLGRPGASPELIAPFAQGTQAVAFQGDWYVFFGSSLYRVVL